MITGDIDLTLMQRFRENAERVLPGRIARVLLFGSRARRSARSTSDWDVAVFLKGRATSKDTLLLADAAYDLIVESGQSIHPIALSEDGQEASSLLIERIEAEGVRL